MSTPAPERASGATHWPALDGLRALSVLAVVMLHAGSRFGRGGDTGVDVFFVLSGFLITAILLREHDRSGRIRLSAFYRRRFLRLFPALALLLACLTAYFLARPSGLGWDTIHAIPVTLLYVMNWVAVATDMHIGVLGHTWSLAVEEQFYLIWPVCLWLALRRGASTRALVTIAGAGVAAGTLWRAWLFHSGQGWSHVSLGSDTRGDALLLGCLAGTLVIRSRPWLLRHQAWLRPAAWAAAAVLCLVTIVGLDHSSKVYGGWSLVHLAAAVLILQLVLLPRGAVHRTLSRRPLVLLGRISYGVYLWQTPLILLIKDQWPTMPARAVLPVSLLATLACASASYVLVERPLLKFKSESLRIPALRRLIPVPRADRP